MEDNDANADAGGSDSPVPAFTLCQTLCPLYLHHLINASQRIYRVANCHSSSCRDEETEARRGKGIVHRKGVSSQDPDQAVCLQNLSSEELGYFAVCQQQGRLL